MKTAFIYDKWYSTLGGAEVVASHLALTLHKLGYNTTIITGSSVELDKIKSIQGLNLSAIHFIESFNDQKRLDQITTNSDIFINCSFWDYSTSKAAKNYYYCFFPTPLKNQALKQFLTSIIQPYEKTQNNKYIFYNLDPSKVTTLKFSTTLENFSKTNLLLGEVKLENAKIIKRHVLINHFKNQVTYKYHFQPFTNSIWFTTQLPVKIYQYPFQNKLFSILRSGLFTNIKNNLTHFDKIFATSVYTKKWINKYWNFDSTLIYPPVPLISTIAKNKKNQICSVGRYTKSGNNKKHEIMIQAFQKMIDAGLTGWELHLAGGLGQEHSSQQYAKSLQDMIKDYPIHLHFSPTRDFIESLLLDSSIYWHAAGYGLDPNSNPEQFEHFGITPVEGISAGCIPVVYDGGGLPEITSVAGLDPIHYVFHTIDELITKTQNIITGQNKLPPKAIKNINDKFSISAFQNELTKQINL